MTNLRHAIEMASQAYYSGDPIMSDDEFDTLIEQLREEDPNDPLLSKTSYGYDPNKDSSGNKVRHKYRHVGSLDKINFWTCEKYLKQHTYPMVVTSKIDGGSVVLYYGADGSLEKAVTRGDGEYGIDCTNKMKHIVTTHSTPMIAVRGEITMKLSTFNKFYPEAASPRNTAMGILNKDNPTKEELQRLSFVAYSLYTPSKSHLRNKTAIMDLLDVLGFEAAEYMHCSSLTPEYLEGLKGKLDEEYLADGLVLTNEYDRFNEIAYKFVAESATSTVTNVEWETSRLGNVIPVVHFNNVKLSGANLSKCSGFNAKWIENNKIGVGSKVEIHRAGEVIPYIKDVLTQSELCTIPQVCPSCSSSLRHAGVHVRCNNAGCSAKTVPNILLWYNTMARVDSLGDKIMEEFIKVMGWRSIADIYSTTTKQYMVGLDKMSTKHERKLLAALCTKLYVDKVNPDLFFAGFGAPNIGETTSKRIICDIGIHNYFLDAEAPPTSVASLPRITEPAVGSLHYHYATMRSVYVLISNSQGFADKTNTKPTMSVVITGKLSKSRKEFEAELSSAGISVANSISNGVNYLITDDPQSGSSKNKSAEALGIPKVTESDFRRMVKL